MQRACLSRCGLLVPVRVDSLLTPSPANLPLLPTDPLRCALAMLYESGVPTVLDQDLTAAAAMYNRSAALGNATAQFTMGVLFAHGVLGVPQDDTQALLHYYFASLGGSAAAQVALGYVWRC